MPQSRLINAIDLQSEEWDDFRRGWERMLTMPQEIVLQLARELPRLRALRTPEQAERFVEEQTRRLGISRVDAAYVVEYVLDPLLEKQLPRRWLREDPPDIIVADLEALDMVKPQDRGRVAELFRALRDEVLPEIEHVLREQATSAGVLPSLRSFAATVEVRAVLEERFRYGGDLAAWAPRIVGTVPLVSAQITLDSGTPNSFCFQCGEQELDFLMDGLQAAKQELAALKAYQSGVPRPRQPTPEEEPS